MKRGFDVIIVGGGPGGLAAGALLAREGVSVAIVEKAPAVGGRYRSIEFHGCRVDSGIHFIVSLYGTPEKCYAFRLFKDLGLPLDYKAVPWAMCLVSKERPGEVEYFAMDSKLGPANFFEFFAFATGVRMEESAKDELLRVASITADMSEEECRKIVDVTFADWIDNNIKDPVAAAVLYGMEPIVGAPVKQMNFGMVASAFGTFNTSGAPMPWYPKTGTLEDAIITPLAQCFTKHGGEIITHRTVRSITIENGEIKGVVAQNSQNNYMLEEFSAPVVISAIPIFEAVTRNILRREFLTEEWLESIKRCEAISEHDLSGFYLLRKKFLTDQPYDWVHVFDVDYGLPTYVGDWGLASHTNATEPKDKQLVCSYISGSGEAAYFGLTAPMEMVWKANRMFLEGMEKGYPGFIEAIEHEGLNVQLSHGRYAYATVPAEIDIQSPNIQGLYFTGDSVRSVGSAASDKVFQLAYPVCERVLEYVRG